MRIGLALPQYDFSLGDGTTGLTFPMLSDLASAAEAWGFDSLWLSDHLFWDLAKYGGPPDRRVGFEPLVTLASLARVVERARLGTLVLCEALRPPAVLAHALATLDRVTGGRLDAGLGAGWYAPEYEAIGMALPSPGVRIARLREALAVVGDLLRGETVDFEGEHLQVRGARLLPPPVQQPRPPLFVGGSGDRLLGVIAERADGWNTCWRWEPDGYRERLAVLEAACARVGRDPATVWRSLGLYALCGEDDADLERRWQRLKRQSPPGVLDDVSLDEWRVGRLVGTVAEVRAQAATWADLGVETLICTVGAVPFHVGDPDDVALLADALAPLRGQGGGAAR